MENLRSGLTAQRNIATCPNCLSHHISQTEEIESFQYGVGEALVNLNAGIPVNHCRDCGMTFTDEVASEIRHEAVCRHLGVMTPREVRSIRANLSQEEFADLTKLGKASIARWESGTKIQNMANDYYLYLLSFRDNVDRLREREQLPLVEKLSSFGKFRKISAKDEIRLRKDAAEFELFV
jgi:DNA-binding transcriptional regulator YiaG